MYQWKWHNFLHLVITPAGGAVGQSLSPLNLSLPLSRSWPWSPYYCWPEIGGQSDGRKLDKRHPRGHFFSSSTPVGSYPHHHHQGSAEKDEDNWIITSKRHYTTHFFEVEYCSGLLTYTIQLQTSDFICHASFRPSSNMRSTFLFFNFSSFFYKVHVIEA